MPLTRTSLAAGIMQLTNGSEANLEAKGGSADISIAHLVARLTARDVRIERLPATFFAFRKAVGQSLRYPTLRVAR